MLRVDTSKTDNIFSVKLKAHNIQIDSSQHTNRKLKTHKHTVYNVQTYNFRHTNTQLEIIRQLATYKHTTCNIHGNLQHTYGAT